MLGPYVGMSLVLLLPIQKWIVVPKYLSTMKDFGVKLSPLITAVDQLPVKVSVAIVLASAVAVLVAAREVKSLLVIIALLLLVHGVIGGTMAIDLSRLLNHLS